jgi:nucleotide-binding universal stress UspA family protein
VRGLFRRILAAHDFSRHADRALVAALAIARRHGATVTVLHVASPIALPAGFPPVVTYRPPSAAARAEVAKRLDRRVRRLNRRVQATVRIAVGDAYDRIVAAGRGHDLIVLGTQGLSGVPHLVIGSVAEKVVRHATVPVLTVRAPSRRRR